MTNEITHAPKEVIEALDNWQEITDTQFIYVLMDDIEYGRFDSTDVDGWIYENSEDLNVWLQRELAVIEHVFGDTRLEAEDDK